MNPNLDACYWAEQVNRRRLADRAARGWLAQQAAASRPTEGEASKPRRAAGGVLVRAGTRWWGTLRPSGTMKRLGRVNRGTAAP